jgi:hypothetical protein
LQLSTEESDLMVQSVEGCPTSEPAVSLLEEPANSHDERGVRAFTHEQEEAAKLLRDGVEFSGCHGWTSEAPEDG